jgi:hypothetical protein
MLIHHRSQTGSSMPGVEPHRGKHESVRPTAVQKTSDQHPSIYGLSIGRTTLQIVNYSILTHSSHCPKQCLSLRHCLGPTRFIFMELPTFLLNALCHAHRFAFISPLTVTVNTSSLWMRCIARLDTGCLALSLFVSTGVLFSAKQYPWVEYWKHIRASRKKAFWRLMRQ